VAALWLALAASARGETFAVTFDDLPLNGPLPAGTTRERIAIEVARILRAHHVPPSVGFANGAALEDGADARLALQRWLDGGQRLGNHGAHHLDLHRVGPAAFLEDVDAHERAMAAVAPPDPRRWFRYPYLNEGASAEQRDAVRSALEARGYRIAAVTLEFQDYLWNAPYARCSERHDRAALRRLRASYLESAIGSIAAERAAARQLFGRDIPHVLLLHLGAITPHVLDRLLTALERQQLQPATLEAVAADAAYRIPRLDGPQSGTLLGQWAASRGEAGPSVPPRPADALEAVCRTAPQP
jgi:peptidoglycan/xylan/chitin deacetylase (PgdA/CDA1 family)